MRPGNLDVRSALLVIGMVELQRYRRTAAQTEVEAAAAAPGRTDGAERDRRSKAEAKATWPKRSAVPPPQRE